MHIDDFTIGSDPEFFLVDRNTGRITMPNDLTTGTKTKPERIFVTPGRFYIGLQRDGMSLEWTLPPSKLSTNMLSRQNAAALAFIENNLLRKYNEEHGTNLHLCPDISATFSEEELEQVPFEHRRIGCSPDFDALTGEAIDRSHMVDAHNIPLSPVRFVGGHMHIGWTKDAYTQDPAHLDACRLLTKGLGLLLASLDSDNPAAMARNREWSSTLAYRPTSYGVEIRAPTTLWLLHTSLTERVQNLVIRFIKKLLEYGPSSFYMGRQCLLNWNGDTDSWNRSMVLYSLDFGQFLFELEDTPARYDTLFAQTLSSSRMGPTRKLTRLFPRM